MPGFGSSRFAPAKKSSQIIYNSLGISARPKGLLDHRELALVDLEIEQLPRFLILAGQMFRDLPLEFRLRHLLGFVQLNRLIFPHFCPFVFFSVVRQL